nr:immunoglobulin light chain junction region [Macaca mulatta]MPO07279.1 immunoglobulin light chain junction region [Macaca mulatta]
CAAWDDSLSGYLF